MNNSFLRTNIERKCSDSFMCVQINIPQYVRTTLFRMWKSENEIQRL